MPTTINSKPDTERALSTHKALATKDANEAVKLVISSDAEYEKASDMLVRVKGHLREVTTQKKKITDPMNQALKETRALFKPIEDKLEDAKSTISNGMLAFRAQQRAEAEAKEAELQAAVDSGDMDLDDALTEMPTATQDKTTYGKKGATTVRTIKEIVVEDPKLVPAEYWVLDMTAIRKDALGNAAQGVEPISIPGVKVIERESL